MAYGKENLHIRLNNVCTVAPNFHVLLLQHIISKQFEKVKIAIGITYKTLFTLYIKNTF